jgi:N-methylhydantoinase A
VEVVAVAAEAVLPTSLPDLPRRSSAPAAPVRTRTAWFGGRPVPCPVLPWDSLATGQRVTGPAFVESASTTLVVHPGQAAVAEPAGHLRLLLGAAA